MRECATHPFICGTTYIPVTQVYLELCFVVDDDDDDNEDVVDVAAVVATTVVTLFAYAS